MSRSILPITLCLAAVVAVSPASAQGVIELGGFGGYTTFDNSLPFAKQALPGARFSVRSPIVPVTASAGHVRSCDDATGR